ncbi:MAG: fibronectin type III domain-containing protein [Planctomycetes bacterium]|nr:fibronectin type III domain-containing protein [Planctomycetota bacterium]
MHARHVIASLAFALALLGLIALLPAGQTPPGQTPPQPAGGLTGKRIYMSPGHGYYYDDDGTSPNLGWTTQRGDTFGLIEDIHTNEMVLQYVTQYLYRAGAKVFPCRERDKQTNEVVINNEVGAPQYSETGSWTTTTSTGLGYAGSQYRYVATSATETATAVWRPTIPAAGYYSVHVWYYASSNRVTNAKFRVTHSGGTSTVTVNQQIYSSRWLWLGEYYFEPGTAGYVTLSNQSPQSGVVIADAARFGAGMGSINHGGGTSGKPRWKECSVYWLEYLGAPSSVTNYYGVDRNDDIVARPLYADWQEGPTWTPDACYYSQHTNAGGGTGTDTFVHDTSPSPGSIPYQDYIHPQLINDLRNAWDPAWYDRGQKTANFGEVRAVDSMPAILCELAFHDKQTPDNDYLWEDDFRRLSARAIYKGILRYFAAASAYAPGPPPNDLFSQDPNPAVTIAPLPPRNFRVINNGNGTLQCSWAATVDPLEATATPTAYKLYRSTNGKGFDDGTNVGNVTTTAVGGLTPGTVYYFQVTALNAGGESFPGETLCARVNSSGVARILLVNAFDRVDRTVREREAENTHDYVIQHAQAIAAVPSGVYFFDSASNEAVGAGLVTLTGYYTIDWILGEESTSDETFTSAEQTQIGTYLDGAPGAPRALFTSGAEVAWDLGQGSATAADLSFLNNRLKCAYATDDAAVYSANGVTGSAFNGLSGITFDNGTQGLYNVDYPDTFAAAGGGASCMTYTGGAVAGVQYDATFKAITLGFPFETIYPDTSRTSVMERVLQFLHPTPNSAPVITPVVPNITTNEDTPTTYSLATHETDAEDTNPNLLVWSINGPNPALFSASISQTTDLLTVTPAANASGSQGVTLILTDSGGLTDTQNITVTINAVNDAPTVGSSLPDITVSMGQPYTPDPPAYGSPGPRSAPTPRSTR